MVEHLRTVDLQVADVWELGHRSKRHGIATGLKKQIVDERRARLPNASVDDHRADAADLLETTHVPDRRCRLLSLDRHRMFADVHERRYDIQIPAIGQLECFPMRVRTLVRPAPDLKLDRLRWILESLLFDVCVCGHLDRKTYLRARRSSCSLNSQRYPVSVFAFATTPPVARYLMSSLNSIGILELANVWR